MARPSCPRCEQRLPRKGAGPACNQRIDCTCSRASAPRRRHGPCCRPDDGNGNVRRAAAPARATRNAPPGSRMRRAAGVRAGDPGVGHRHRWCASAGRGAGAGPAPRAPDVHCLDGRRTARLAGRVRSIRRPAFAAGDPPPDQAERLDDRRSPARGPASAESAQRARVDPPGARAAVTPRALVRLHCGRCTCGRGCRGLPRRERASSASVVRRRRPPRLSRSGTAPGARAPTTVRRCRRPRAFRFQQRRPSMRHRPFHLPSAPAAPRSPRRLHPRCPPPPPGRRKPPHRPWSTPATPPGCSPRRRSSS